MDAGKIKLLVMDVDGTLTDGKIYMGPDGEVMKAFSAKDGYAIKEMLPKLGIEPVIITGRKSAIVERRCEELGIELLFQGVGDKLTVLESLLEERGISMENVAYVGDDLNDLPCMKTVNAGGGFTACPMDGIQKLQDIVAFVSSKSGVQGFLRDVIEHLQDSLHLMWSSDNQ